MLVTTAKMALLVLDSINNNSSSNNSSSRRTTTKANSSMPILTIPTHNRHLISSDKGNIPHKGLTDRHRRLISIIISIITARTPPLMDITIRMAHIKARTCMRMGTIIMRIIITGITTTTDTIITMVRQK